MTLTVEADNPSAVEIVPAGRLSFDMLFQGSMMGVIHSPNISIYRGLNMCGPCRPCLLLRSAVAWPTRPVRSLPLLGFIEPTNMTALNILFSEYLSGAPVPAAQHARAGLSAARARARRPTVPAVGAREQLVGLVHPAVRRRAVAAHAVNDAAAHHQPAGDHGRSPRFARPATACALTLAVHGRP